MLKVETILRCAIVSRAFRFFQGLADVQEVSVCSAGDLVAWRFFGEKYRMWLACVSAKVSLFESPRSRKFSRCSQCVSSVNHKKALSACKLFELFKWSNQILIVLIDFGAFHRFRSGLFTEQTNHPSVQKYVWSFGELLCILWIPMHHFCKLCHVTLSLFDFLRLCLDETFETFQILYRLRNSKVFSEDSFCLAIFKAFWDRNRQLVYTPSCRTVWTALYLYSFPYTIMELHKILWAFENVEIQLANHS